MYYREITLFFFFLLVVHLNVNHLNVVAVLILPDTAFQRSVSNAQRLFNNMKEKYVPWAPTGEQEWTPDLTTGESITHRPLVSARETICINTGHSQHSARVNICVNTGHPQHIARVNICVSTGHPQHNEKKVSVQVTINIMHKCLCHYRSLSTQCQSKHLCQYRSPSTQCQSKHLCRYRSLTTQCQSKHLCQYRSLSTQGTNICVNTGHSQHNAQIEAREEVPSQCFSVAPPPPPTSQ